MGPSRVTRAGVKASSLTALACLPTFVAGLKRAAELSPRKNQRNKRAALVDVTNKNVNVPSLIATDVKQAVAEKPPNKGKKTRRTNKETKVVTSRGNKTGLQIAKSSSDVTRSDSNVSRSDSNLSRSDSNMSRSDSNVSRSDSNMSRSDSNVSRSDSNVSRSDSNVSRSDINVSRSDINVSRSDINVSRSDINVSRSDSNVSQMLQGSYDSGCSQLSTEQGGSEQPQEKLMNAEAVVTEGKDLYHDAVEHLSPETAAEGAAGADDSVLLLSVRKSEPKRRKSLRRSHTRAHVQDVDVENRRDPNLVPDYAQDIFRYYMQREGKFRVEEYMSRQTDINISMRAIVVDWMVEVQENFELNHETLYMAIRLMDLYLTKQMVQRDKLQLVAASALFLACKFDERVPPVLDDFLYVCDDAYKREEYIHMEMMLMRELGFDIGMPSSYRFLRRYAKCGRIGLEVLTLSRYILETSQMEYRYLSYKDSQLAAACLLLAMKMKKIGEWTPTLAYYSTYSAEDLRPLVVKLNTMISLPPIKNLQTIKTKYSHRVFFEVAKTPTLDANAFESVA